MHSVFATTLPPNIKLLLVILSQLKYSRPPRILVYRACTSQVLQYLVNLIPYFPSHSYSPPLSIKNHILLPHNPTTLSQNCWVRHCHVYRFCSQTIHGSVWNLLPHALRIPVSLQVSWSDLVQEAEKALCNQLTGRVGSADLTSCNQLILFQYGGVQLSPARVHWAFTLCVNGYYLEIGIHYCTLP